MQEPATDETQDNTGRAGMGIEKKKRRGRGGNRVKRGEKGPRANVRARARGSGQSFRIDWDIRGCEGLVRTGG
jgi:hypothetical protein